MSEWFPVNVGLRQGCVMPQWLFNVYMARVVREVNGKGLELLSGNGGRFEINRLLFAADDTSLVADSEEKLCGLVGECGRVCERRKLRVNVYKSKDIKVMRCRRYGSWGRMDVILNHQPLENVDCFK